MTRKIETTVTFLEMTAAPHFHQPMPAGKLALVRAEKPPVAFYRFLYDTVGSGYTWVDRRALDDDKLAEVIQHPDVEIYVLYRNGCPSGYFELDFRKAGEAELAYLGLMPEAVGQGLGRYLLSQAISIAWQHGIDRLIVQTCTLDHPRALALYQRCGFEAYAQEVKTMVLPEEE